MVFTLETQTTLLGAGIPFAAYGCKTDISRCLRILVKFKSKSFCIPSHFVKLKLQLMTSDTQFLLFVLLAQDLIDFPYQFVKNKETTDSSASQLYLPKLSENCRQRSIINI